MKEKKTFKLTWLWVKEWFMAGWWFYLPLVLLCPLIVLIALKEPSHNERFLILIWVLAPLLVILGMFMSAIYDDKHDIELENEENEEEEAEAEYERQEKQK